jgi:hypothetical protein
MRHHRFSASLVLALSILPVFSARSVDGVLEINQTCAQQTGCFVGDQPGYPVSITLPGSYRLTSNLVVPDENTDGIVVNTSDVRIDLNDFSIIGAGCVGVATNCTPSSGTGSGVERTANSNRGLFVKNGSIVGMGNYGVYLGDQSEVSNLNARWNRFTGIFVGNSSIVTGSSAYQNGGTGISAANAAVLSRNTAYLNGGTGIFTSFGSTVSENTAYSNAADGISASSGSIIRGNTSNDNFGNGIVALTGCTVDGNNVRGNDGYGLSLSSTTTYRNNTVTSFAIPVPLGTINSGVDMGGNSCDGKTTCP